MKHRMGIWWSQRSSRERLLLQMMAVLILSVLLLQGLLLPAREYRDSGMRLLERQSRTHADVVRTLEQGHRIVEKSDETPRSLSAVLSDTAASRKLQLNRVRTAENESVNISLSAASPESLYSWLGELQNQHSISVLRSSIRRTEHGLDASLYLERAR